MRIIDEYKMDCGFEGRWINPLTWCYDLVKHRLRMEYCRIAGHHYENTVVDAENGYEEHCCIRCGHEISAWM